MRTGMRVAAATVVSTLALISPGSAQAQIEVVLTVEDVNLIMPFVTEVSGTVECGIGGPAGVDIFVTIFQRPDRQAFGFTSFLCPEEGFATWTLTALGGPLHPGRASLFGTLAVCEASFCFEDTDIRVIQIRP